MPQIFRTAMVGLGRSDVVALRQTFQSIFSDDQYQFDWVTADEPQLDILLVNSFFTASTSIQKIMQRDHVACLIVDHESNTLSVTGDSLHLPVKDTGSIVDWFYQAVLGMDKPATSVHRAAPAATPAAPAVMAEKATIKETVIKETLSKLPPAPLASRPSYPAGQGHHSIRENIDAVLAKKTGVWALKDQQGFTLAVVDIPQQLAWVVPDYQQQKTHVRLPLLLSSDYQPPAGFLARDLKQWLWQLAWDMESEHALLDKKTICVLQNWPQPSVSNQKILLQACAYLKNKPASAEQLGHELKLPLIEIQRLFTACFAVGFAAEFNRDIHGVTQSAASTAVQQEVPAEQNTFLRGFLSRFRQKLGL